MATGESSRRRANRGLLLVAEISCDGCFDRRLEGSNGPLRLCDLRCAIRGVAAPPAHCPICDDERQYVGPRGQQWTTLDTLRQDHHNVIATVADNLTGIMTEPKVAIGQQAHLIATPAGNVLWNCISYIDDATVAAVNDLGGLAAIAISTPTSTPGWWSGVALLVACRSISTL